MNMAAVSTALVLTAEEVENELRHWGRVYGQRPPTEWEEDASLTPSPAGQAMTRAPASEMGRAHRLGLLKHVNTEEKHCPARNWGQFEVACTETRSFRTRSPRPDARADLVERECLALYRVEPGLAIVLRLTYCTRGTLAEKAQWAGVVTGERVTRREFRTALDQARWWMRGAINRA